MANNHVLETYNNHISDSSSFFTHTFESHPLLPKNSQKRPLSVSIEDAFFGDSGKGRVTVELNQLLQKQGHLFSVRYNGGANAGHECYINGKPIVTHQLPIAIIQENATALIARGTVVHPQDLVTEIHSIKKLFKNSLPGKLVIDERTVLSLDTHRALETAINSYTTGGRGSTGRGIATAYASIYERTPVTMKDLMAKNWKDILKNHYRFLSMKTRGFGKKYELETIFVNRLSAEKIAVGNENEFIQNLEHARSELQKYVSSTVFFDLQTAWNNPKIPFTIEGAQGAGLDPYHGVYPDVTSSRPMSRFINDATYNVILPEEIAVRLAVMKTTYVSSVGQRTLPTEKNAKHEAWIQKAFDEKGRSTGRLRDIYEVSIPIAQYLQRAAGYEYLVATHLDASQKKQPIRVVSHYTHKKTGEKMPYLPYQDYLDDLKPHIIEFNGWDPKEVQKAKSTEELPDATKLFISFLSTTIAPVIIGTTSPELGSYLSWLPEL